MLDPHQRKLLSEALQVPEGCELTDALACTYSLDLLALASIPLLCLGHESYALDGTEADADADVGRQLAGLECVRRNMDKFTVFCQAGAIHVPAQAKSSFVWLEPSLVEVTPPDPKGHGVFHPKIWFLRFRTAEGGVRYRMVVLSRNLTFDRSWDVLAQIEGEVASGRSNRIQKSTGIADFVAALGTQIPAINPMSAANSQRVALFAQELGKTKFSAPDPQVDWTFWPLGDRRRNISAKRLFQSKDSPFSAWAEGARSMSGRRLLVVAPFLGAGVVKSLVDLSNEGTCVHLVSDQVTLDDFAHCAAPQPQGLGLDKVWAFASHDASDPLTGLHSKLWVADDGRHAHVWLGSANATDAAFERNVEVLLQLSGPKSLLGVQTLLQEREDVKAEPPGFRDLLVSYRPPDEPVEDASSEDARQRALEFRLTAFVASAPLSVSVTGAGPYSMQLRTTVAEQVEVRPITLAEEDGRGLDPRASRATSFDDLDLYQLTELWVLRMTDGELVSSCVTRVPTEGMPSHQERGLAAMSRHLGSMQALTEYLGFLMADGSSAFADRLRITRRGKGAGAASASKPLLEVLMQALVMQPEVLSDVEALLSAVGKDAGDWIADPSFQALWAAIRDAKGALLGLSS